MDLIYPQSGIAIPGKDSRSLVLPPIPGKKVVNITPYYSPVQLVLPASFGDVNIITNTDENIAYFVRLFLTATSGLFPELLESYLRYFVLPDAIGTRVYANTFAEQSGGGDAHVVQFAYDEMVFSSLLIHHDLTNSAILVGGIQGFQINLTDI